jgi:DnaJ-class molecular chaperone
MPQPLISIHCYLCFGTGMIRKMNMIGVYLGNTTCTRCKGIGKLWVEKDSREHRKGQIVGAVGIWKPQRRSKPNE